MKNLRMFVTGLASEPLIPSRDKKVLMGLAAYLAMPFDLLPDFIPILGYLDDLLVAIVVLDYVFNVVPEPLVLAHFPWRPERYHSIRRCVRFASRMIPDFIRLRLWKITKSAKSRM